MDLVDLLAMEARVFADNPVADEIKKRDILNAENPFLKARREMGLPEHETWQHPITATASDSEPAP